MTEYSADGIPKPDNRVLNTEGEQYNLTDPRFATATDFLIPRKILFPQLTIIFLLLIQLRLDLSRSVVEDTTPLLWMVKHTIDRVNLLNIMQLEGSS